WGRVQKAPLEFQYKKSSAAIESSIRRSPRKEPAAKEPSSSKEDHPSEARTIEQPKSADSEGSIIPRREAAQSPSDGKLIPRREAAQSPGEGKVIPRREAAQSTWRTEKSFAGEKRTDESSVGVRSASGDDQDIPREETREEHHGVSPHHRQREEERGKDRTTSPHHLQREEEREERIAPRVSLTTSKREERITLRVSLTTSARKREANIPSNISHTSNKEKLHISSTDSVNTRKGTEPTTGIPSYFSVYFSERKNFIVTKSGKRTTDSTARVWLCIFFSHSSGPGIIITRGKERKAS
ncbi:putative uncharacterized protein DDB_G0271982, partial [Phlebotomus papatasi]|uniref:putative uncharacterized protein DDB_G0271982 n=1 Tax=Phlebotomus papatasi TaxID=29031 RepID=UPI0024840E72